MKKEKTKRDNRETENCNETQEESGRRKLENRKRIEGERQEENNDKTNLKGEGNGCGRKKKQTKGKWEEKEGKLEENPSD